LLGLLLFKWVWTARAADGDSASTAKARRKLAAAMCKRLQELLTCLRVLVGTVIAMPVIIDQQVRGKGEGAGFWVGGRWAGWLLKWCGCTGISVG
jgi:hypothetical protein